MPIKKITITEDIQKIILTSQFEQVLNNLHLTLQGQLDRKTYTETNKFLELMGGKWNRKLKCHIFEDVTQEELRQTYSNRELAIEKDGYFPTPHKVTDFMWNLVDFYNGSQILEPSAGEGHIADWLVDNICDKERISIIEKNEKRQKILLQKGYNLVGTDCLTHTQKYDIIIANPPFESGQDVDHLSYLFDNCLNKDGQLISVMSNGVTFREDKKYKNFREIYTPDIYELPEGSFKESGTMVNTVVIKLSK